MRELRKEAGSGVASERAGAVLDWDRLDGTPNVAVVIEGEYLEMTMWGGGGQEGQLGKGRRHVAASS